MKVFLFILVLLLQSLYLYCQSFDRERIEGVVSYKSMSNTYVRFSSTKGILVGDTLFMLRAEQLEPVLVIRQKSSLSCVASAVQPNDVLVGDKVLALVVVPKVVEKEVIESPLDAVILAQEKIEKARPSRREEMIHGRVSLASYTNASNTSSDVSQRMRYTLSLMGDNLRKSKFSLDSYVSFTHKSGEWDVVQDNIYRGLKVYSLALKYDISENTKVWFGRKINGRIANIGAIDGVQIESVYKDFTFGLVGGARPDYSDYSFNANLFQFGGYVAHMHKTDAGSAQTSLAFMEQNNNGFTDRRFVYFQHSNSMIRNLYLFASCELDLYKRENNEPVNKGELTGLYLSVRYRPGRMISFFTSYDARRNVIYYETFKNYIDQIIENETRQGIRMRINVRPLKYLSVSTNAGFRYRKGDAGPSENASVYVSYSRVPWLDASLSMSTSYMKTAYLDGFQYGINASKDIMNGKLYATLNYRLVDYNFVNSPTNMLQHISDFSLSWKIAKKLSLITDYELSFEGPQRYNRIYLSLVKRF